MKPDEQQRLFDNTARSLGGASEQVPQRHIANRTTRSPGPREPPLTDRLCPHHTKESP
jgi:hypothetical protein